MYLKCDTADCKGTAKIDQGLLVQYTQIRRRPIYCENPLLAHSTYVTFTVKFHCLQIPTSPENLTLPSKSNTCKFQDGRFTAKIHYLQIQLLANSYNPTEGAKTSRW